MAGLLVAVVVVAVVGEGHLRTHPVVAGVTGCLALVEVGGQVRMEVEGGEEDEAHFV